MLLSCVHEGFTILLIIFPLKSRFRIFVNILTLMNTHSFLHLVVPSSPLNPIQTSQYTAQHSYANCSLLSEQCLVLTDHDSQNCPFVTWPTPTTWLHSSSELLLVVITSIRLFCYSYSLHHLILCYRSAFFCLIHHDFLLYLSEPQK